MVDAARASGRAPAVVVLAGEHVDRLVGPLAINQHQRRGFNKGHVDPDHCFPSRHGQVGAVGSAGIEPAIFAM